MNTNMSNSPSPTASSGRDNKGRFGLGNKAGTGNPYAKRVAQLREMCTARGLDQSGTKPTLVKRLLADGKEEEGKDGNNSSAESKSGSGHADELVGVERRHLAEIETLQAVHFDESLVQAAWCAAGRQSRFVKLRSKTREPPQMIATMASCPSSTPTLNPKRAGTRRPAGSPISINTFAKPKPWIRPKSPVKRGLNFMARTGSSARRR